MSPFLVRKRFACLTLGIAGVALGAAVTLLVVYPRPRLRVDEVLAAYREDLQYGGLTISYPLDETLFPPEIVAPTFRWKDSREESNAWVVTIEFEDAQGRMSFPSLVAEWTPSDEQWERIRRGSWEKQAKVTILGVNRTAPRKILSAASISISTSQDEVGAPIFYREVNLPFAEAVKDPSHIRWRLGMISSREQPPLVLEKLPVCGNCHSFSADGKILGMDVDYANTKGSYVIDRVAKAMVFSKSKIITWDDYRKEDGEPTFGLLSQVSPDGRYVLSTVKDLSVFVAKDDLAFSQLFFPIKGILVVYDRTAKSFHALPGADDPRFVQSNPTWSPDGKQIVFARSQAHHLANVQTKGRVLLEKEECREFLEGGRTFLFDLYRIPFNGGKGGQAEPLEGASDNGMSNYFPRFSPDGKWIVFCRAKSFMLLQPDSELFIIPAQGGQARRLRCNTSRMNSWHSWSPNGRWLVFSSKANSAYTQLFLTHMDEQGRSSPPVLLSQFTAFDRAANIPEFVNAAPGAIKRISEQFVDDYSYLRAAKENIRHGHLDQAERELQKALDLNPDNAEPWYVWGVGLVNQGRFQEAKGKFLRTVELEPGHADAHRMLGMVFRRENKLPEAVESYREALRIEPESAEAHLYLGILLLEIGRWNEAKGHLSEAARLDPKNPVAHFSLAVVLQTEKKPDLAVAHLDQALQEEPGFLPAILNLASIRATSREDALRNGRQAVDLATRACEMTRYQDPEALDTLAAAYAEVGQFSEAIATARQALRLARAARSNALADAIARRIGLYEQEKPFREVEGPPPGHGEQSPED